MYFLRIRNSDVCIHIVNISFSHGNPETYIHILNLIINTFSANHELLSKTFVSSTYRFHMEILTNYITILNPILNVFHASPDFLPKTFISSIYRFHVEIDTNYIPILNPILHVFSASLELLPKTFIS